MDKYYIAFTGSTHIILIVLCVTKFNNGAEMISKNCYDYKVIKNYDTIKMQVHFVNLPSNWYWIMLLKISNKKKTR